MRNLQIEALFGGVLALAVIAVAAFAVMNTTFDGSADASPAGAHSATTATVFETKPVPIRASGGGDLVCECYDKAFELAGRTKVLSPQYRAGFEQCRARGGVDGGDAWTAGWNARLSAKPYEASCRAYKRRR